MAIPLFTSLASFAGATVLNNKMNCQESDKTNCQIGIQARPINGRDQEIQDGLEKNKQKSLRMHWKDSEMKVFLNTFTIIITMLCPTLKTQPHLLAMLKGYLETLPTPFN